METTKSQDKSNYSAKWNEDWNQNEMKKIETITIEKSRDKLYIKLLLQFRLKK